MSLVLEVQVEVQKSGVCMTDVHLLDKANIGDIDVVTSPVVLGHEFSGVVTKVGPGVTNVMPGSLSYTNKTEMTGLIKVKG